MSNGAFKNKIIHFGSCETVKSEKRVEAFLTESKALMISGDLKQIDFLESVAMDLLYFNAAQDYKSSKYLKKFIENNYAGLKDYSNINIKLFDITGRQVHSMNNQSSDKIPLKVNDLSKGVYVVQVLQGSRGVGVLKMVLR